MRQNKLILLSLLLSGCTTANDVALREAQAAIEQARVGQALAVGLSNVATLNAWVILLPVLLVCVCVLILLADRWQTRKMLRELQQRQLATPKTPVRRPQPPRLDPGYLTWQEQLMILEMRRRQSSPDQWIQAENIESDEVDVWPGQ